MSTFVNHGQFSSKLTTCLLLAILYYFYLIKLFYRDFASTETIDTSALASKKERLENLDQANAEIEKLRKLGEKLTGELQGKKFFGSN